MDREKGSRRLVFVCMVFIMSFIPSHVYAAEMTIGNTIVTTGDWTMTGTMNATSFTGDGSGLTNLNGGNITSGTISGAALAPGAVGAAALGANAVTPANIAFFSNVAIVAPSGGDYNNPATAMSDYSTWCGTPSSTNPCLLKIMPGVYNVGSSTVVMQPYIDIEGSGENTTTITGAISSGGYPPAGTVTGASNTEIRFLTVANTSTGSFTAAILNSAASPSMLHVTATSSYGTTYNYGVVNSNSSSPIMTNVTVTASGAAGYNYGVYNDSSSPTMTNVTVTVSAGSGSHNYGVLNNSSSPTMTNVTATASGGAYTFGVFNIVSSPTMTNVTVTASGAAGYNHGVYNESSSPTMTNVTVTASGGTNSYGVYSLAGGTVKINHSVISANTDTVGNGIGGTTYVGNTQLAGGAVSNSGTLTCVGAYNASYVALSTSCQ